MAGKGNESMFFGTHPSERKELRETEEPKKLKLKDLDMDAIDRDKYDAPDKVGESVRLIDVAMGTAPGAPPKRPGPPGARRPGPPSRPGPIRPGASRPGPAAQRPGPAAQRPGPTRPGPARPGPARPGPAPARRPAPPSGGRPPQGPPRGQPPRRPGPPPR